MDVRDRILALDIGTQSTRAVLHDRNGVECAIGRRAHLPIACPAPGAAEQDPEDLWQAVLGSVRECLQGQDSERVAALALTSQRSAVLACDADGVPLHPVISWLDRRVAQETPLVQGLPRRLLRLLAQDSALSRVSGWSRPNILAGAHPEIWEATRKWLTISGWIAYRLTGRFVDASGSIAGVWPFDPRRGQWRGERLVHRLLGFRSGTLPDLVSAGQTLGELTHEASALLDLPPGLPILAVGGDKQAEALGGGIVAGGAAGGLSLGTGASVYLVESRFRSSSLFRYLTNCAAEPKAWVNEVMVMRGYWLVSWFVREFAAEERQQAAEQGTVAEALLSEKALREVPAGAGGLMVLPRFTPAPDIPMERGAMLGLSDDHGRLAMFRAILEGVGYDLRRGLQVLERATGRKVPVLRAGGGGTRSELALRATASILGRPLELGASSELSALGASVCAAAGLGWYPDSATAAKAMTRVSRRIEPDPELQRFYDRQYRQAFVPSLKRVRPLTAWLARNRNS